jgi:hypothetical protein
MRAAQQQIVISRQVWVCDTCGCRDNKSCGCDSVAHAEEIAAKKEAHRQAARTHREKAQRNQQPRDYHAPVENVEESDARPEALPAKQIKHDARVISPELGERVGRLAYRLIRLDIDLARELADLILQRGVAERLWADLGTGIEIEGSDADDTERTL